MITTTTLADARVLIVGVGDLVNAIVQTFLSHGVRHITVVHSDVNADKNLYECINQDPLELIKSDSNYFKSFDIVLAVDQPRAFELELSDLRWPKEGAENDSDLPMIIMRASSNNCKMRCQYHELQFDGNKSTQFVNLSMDLLPWTNEKRALVASTIHDELKLEQHPSLKTYFSAALAVVKFQQAKGVWPTIADEMEIVRLAAPLESGLESKVRDFITLFCEKGLAAAHETITIMSSLVVTDALKLLTGSGHPINNTTMEDVINIMSTA